MRVTVFGSTGRTGAHVLAEGQRRGYEMVAFTRRPEALRAPGGLAAVVTGDGRDRAAVDRAVAGSDAVVAIVSSAGRRGPHHAEEVARTVVGSMATHGVRRLVFTSAYPLVATRPRLPLFVLRKVFADAYADAARMEEVLAASDLDWTVVRLNRLVDRPATGRVVTSTGLFERPASMTRADAAATLLDVALDTSTARLALNSSGG